MLATLLIIDAMNLIRRIYAIQEKQHGESTRAIEETTKIACTALQKLAQQHTPTHVICVFDSHTKSWRHQLYPLYKHGRKPIPTLLKQSLGNIQDQFMKIGFESLLSETDEADDLIATLSDKMAKKKQKCIIVSTDKGFYQLLGPQILIFDHFQNSYTDSGRVLNKMALNIDKLCDYWAITGISSSAIKGVEGVGEKGALLLLHEYGNLQAIFDAPINEKNKPLCKVKKCEHEARLSQQLVTLKKDINLGFNLQDLRYQSHR
ncbi:exonuclease IX [Psychromonas sp. CNPT3]|uniref:flap endonuclease Xni n=1 Tax=Psychromonas sp. CNPT3 TaxID=314282 RepID=UPI00006E915C|nr:flap endonuclease Xni [Psychromonas sp. CNPT3]AGH81856.1 exonuclease IX [Psychromonas sp. CNPT3]